MWRKIENWLMRVVWGCTGGGTCQCEEHARQRQGELDRVAEYPMQATAEVADEERMAANA